MAPPLPKSPISALTGERLPGIGHNMGPSMDGGAGFRRFAWKKARKALMPRLPLEVLKRRVRRAKQLGLEYPAYASILLGTGRDIVGFLFTCDALGMRLSKTIDPPEAVSEKLKRIERVDAMLAAEHDRVDLLPDLLANASGVQFAATSHLPRPDAGPEVGRQSIRTALDPLKLPGDAVVMIGTKAHERAWADAAKLARFIPSDAYFPNA